MFHCVVNFSIKTNEAVYNIFIIWGCIWFRQIIRKIIKQSVDDTWPHKNVLLNINANKYAEKVAA